MHAFDVLGDTVRRRILEMLADGKLTVEEAERVLRFAILPNTAGCFTAGEAVLTARPTAGSSGPNGGPSHVTAASAPPPPGYR